MSFPDIQKDHDLHIVLLYPEIPWNAGNAGRSCLAANATLHLVEPLGFSLDDRYLKRAGLDYWPRVRVRTWPDWDRLAGRLPHLGEPFFFTPEADRSFWDCRFPARTVLIFGREGEGLPPEIRRDQRERCLRIPMAASPTEGLPGDAVRSMNLSTCVALAAYEVLRQWSR